LHDKLIYISIYVSIIIKLKQGCSLRKFTARASFSGAGMDSEFFKEAIIEQIQVAASCSKVLKKGLSVVLNN